METGATGLPIDSLAELRQRRSSKWRSYPADVLPLTVAEMDVSLAPPISEVLAAAVRRHWPRGRVLVGGGVQVLPIAKL